MKLKIVTLNTKVIPVYNQVDFSLFQQNYISVKKNKCKKSYDYILKQIMPTFLIWQAYYESRSYYKDITIYILLRLLEADDKTPGNLNNKLSLLDLY